VLFSSANFGLLGSPVPQVLMIREGGLFDPLYLSTVAPEQGSRLAAMRYLRRWLMLLSARANDHIITPTAATRDLLLAWAPQLEGRCSVNPYGTLVDIFRPAEPPRPWCRDGTLRLLYVSVYYPHKVPGLLCLAAERLAAGGLPCHAAITMTLDEVAAVRGGSYDRFLLERAEAAGQVTLGGHRYDALPAVYAAADVFVFPSISETFGHPLVEAMSSGLPIIAADTPVNREVCGDVALYYPPLSVEGLCACVRRLEAQPGLRAEMIAAGRRRSLERFGWQAHVDRLLEIFEAVQRR
jgi:glycosyltransferase involved in cell wall biosynthesis